ncbi:MAG: hypothetical protein NC120_11530 [Ruminococcus sp.]|nr:hypothetical protein [Ruminococcus sp.]
MSGNHKSHKTPQLMKMLTGGARVSNPLLDEEFKEEIIRSQNDPIPVKPSKGADGRVEINITSELISQWVPVTIKRFHLCSCDRCSAELTVAAFDNIRPIIVNVKDDVDIQRAQALKAQREREILMQIIRIAVGRKKLPRHDGY